MTTSQSYRGLNYVVTQEPDLTWSATIEDDLLRLFGYRNRNSQT
jgi:hypothetical protein